MLVPRIYYFDQPTILNNNFGSFDFLRGRSNHFFYGASDTAESNRVTVGTMSSTCALMVPRQVFEKIGFMDDDYFIYFDDTDFVARSVRAGFLVKYVPESILFHKESMSSGGNKLGPLPLYYLSRNRLQFMKKNQTNALMFVAFLIYFSITQTIHLCKFVLRKDKASTLALTAGIQDYFKGKVGYTQPERYRLSVTK